MIANIFVRLQQQTNNFSMKRASLFFHIFNFIQGFLVAILQGQRGIIKLEYQIAKFQWRPGERQGSIMTGGGRWWLVVVYGDLKKINN